MKNLRFRCLAKILNDEDYKVIRDFVGFDFYNESGYISSKSIQNIYERFPKEELERIFQKYGILEVIPDDGKHSLVDGDPLPKPNVQLMIYCAENNDSVHGGAATLGTDGKWYWTYDMRICKPCKYTVTHWRYL